MNSPMQDSSINVPSKDGRYPYTMACDYIRQFGGCDAGGVRLSRSDASEIRAAIAQAIGMTDEELACKLADYWRANEASLNEDGLRKILAALGSSPVNAG